MDKTINSLISQLPPHEQAAAAAMLAAWEGPTEPVIEYLRARARTRATATPNKERRKLIGVRVPLATYEMITKAAKAKNVSIYRWLIDAIADQLIDDMLDVAALPESYGLKPLN